MLSFKVELNATFWTKQINKRLSLRKSIARTKNKFYEEVKQSLYRLNI